MTNNTDPAGLLSSPQRPAAITDERPDDSEIDAMIEDSEDIGEALADIASKYGAAVTGNEPRWQDGVYLRHLGDFMRDVLNAVRRFESSPHPPTREQIAEVLDKYDQGEGECAPEDCWRLFRDLRALIQNGADRA